MAWPNIRPSKTTKTFASLVPVASLAVVEGVLYDTSHLSIGLKWGMAIGVAIFIVFFGGLTCVVLDS